MEKKERCPNYSEGDRELLLNLANSYKQIIECKKTDGVSWKKK